MQSPCDFEEMKYQEGASEVQWLHEEKEVPG
jgi:hypothetical protein